MLVPMLVVVPVYGQPRREPQAAGRVPPAPPDHPAGEVDLPRRERSDHANDTRLCPRQRRAARAWSHSGRPLEDPHHPQRPEPRRPAGDHDHRAGHRWRHLSGLSRTGAGSEVAARRCARNGQPQRSQGGRGRATDPGCGSGTALPAALLAGPESDREGLGQAETTAPLRQGPHRRSARSSHRRTLTPDHTRKRPSLVPSQRNQLYILSENALSVRVLQPTPETQPPRGPHAPFGGGESVQTLDDLSFPSMLDYLRMSLWVSPRWCPQLA